MIKEDESPEKGSDENPSDKGAKTLVVPSIDKSPKLSDKPYNPDKATKTFVVPSIDKSPKPSDKPYNPDKATRTVIVPSIDKSPKLSDKPYNPDKHRDEVRSHVTYALVILLLLTLFAPLCVLVWDGPAWANAKDFLQMVLPTETALVGSVVGFYFGSRSRDDRQE